MATVCFKCRRSQGVACSRDGASKPYCAECFVEFCMRQIRDNLLKHCCAACEVPLVVAVSGGMSSMTLLHQLGVLRAQNRLRPERGRINFNFIPLHLREDELVVPRRVSGGGGEKEKEREENNGKLHRIAATMAAQFEEVERMIRSQCVVWEFASTPLFTADEVCVVRYGDYMSVDELDAFHGLLHHPRLSLSERELMYTRLRQRVLAAATVECIHRWHHTRGVTNNELFSWYHMLTGENALRCCVTTLHEIMSGNGENFMHLCGFRGFVNQCLVLRPLRTMLPRELVQYCRMQGIKTGYTPSLSTLTSLRSMNRVLELFFNNMLRTYKTSVFNVLNTVSKLQVGAVAAELTSVEPQLGETSRQAKRVIPGKTAQHHYSQLMVKKPPHYSWFDESMTVAASPSSSSLQNNNNNISGNNTHHLCLLCGCLLSVDSGHVVTILQREEKQQRRRFMCDACVTFVQSLPEDVTALSALWKSTEKPALRERDVPNNVLFDTFSSLAARMESLMCVSSDGLEGTEKDGNRAEMRCVRRRLDKHDVKCFLLEDEEGEGEVAE